MSETQQPAEAEDDLPLSQQDDDSVVARVKADKEKWEGKHGEWTKSATAEFGAVAGDQWEDEDEAKLREEGRPPVTFNRLGVLIDAICGSQVNNRQESKFLPRTLDDQGKADIIQGVVTWAKDQCDAEDEESDAFRDLAICGMGWVVNRVDYSEDPTGRFVKDRVSPLEMMWDPAAKKRNLVDARWKAHAKRMPVDEIDATWPGTVAGMNASLGKDGTRALVVLPQRDRYADHEDGNTSDDGTAEVIEYQWCEHEAIWAVQNPQTGQAVYLDKPRYEAFREAHDGKGKDMPRAVRLARPKWYRAVICGDVMLERGECPDPEDSTYQCMTGKRDEKSGTFYGLIRNLRDPQMWANKWLSQSLHILNTSAKSGIIIEENAIPSGADSTIPDIRTFEKDYAKPGSISVVAPGAISQNRFKEKQAPAMPAGFYQLLQFAIMSIPDMSGVNKEVLGIADREQAGVLEAQRKQAAQAVLAPLFDALRLYYKRDGRQVARMVSAYIPAEKQIRITMGDNKDPQLVSTANMPDVRLYDIVVDEAPTSPNQKTEVWQFLAPALPGLMKAGIPPAVWVELLRYSPLPESTVDRVRDLLAAEAEKAAQQPDPEQQKVMMEAQIKRDDHQMQMMKLMQEMRQDQQQHAMKMAEISAKLEATMATEQARAQSAMVKASVAPAQQRPN